jgi:hypothetical protein
VGGRHGKQRCAYDWNEFFLYVHVDAAPGSVVEVPLIIVAAFHYTMMSAGMTSSDYLVRQVEFCVSMPLHGHSASVL